MIQTKIKAADLHLERRETHRPGRKTPVVRWHLVDPNGTAGHGHATRQEALEALDRIARAEARLATLEAAQ